MLCHHIATASHHLIDNINDLLRLSFNNILPLKTYYTYVVFIEEKFFNNLNEIDFDAFRIHTLIDRNVVGKGKYCKSGQFRL